MPSKVCLILRSARRARLEGRTTSVQLSQRSSFGFLHTLFRGGDTEKYTGESVVPHHDPYICTPSTKRAPAVTGMTSCSSVADQMTAVPRSTA
jgi:hypothetical protein